MNEMLAWILLLIKIGIVDSVLLNGVIGTPQPMS